MSYITNFLYFRNAFRSKGGTEIKNIPKLKDIFWNHSQNSEEIGQKKPTIHNRVILKRHRRHSIVHYGATAQFWLRQHHHTAEYSRNTCFVTQFSLRFKNKKIKHVPSDVFWNPILFFNRPSSTRFPLHCCWPILSMLLIETTQQDTLHRRECMIQNSARFQTT
jgi:hypothetical protein